MASYTMVGVGFDYSKLRAVGFVTFRDKRSHFASLPFLPPSSESDPFSSLHVPASKKSRSLFFSKKSFNPILSMMGLAQRDGEGRNVSLAKDVFLCHSGKQKVPVRQLHKELTNKGVSCFFDEDLESLPLTGKFPPRIFEAAEKCRIGVAVISKDFIHSKWPMLELSALLKAISSGKNPHMKILPLFFMLSPKSVSEITVDNQEWKELGISAEVRAEWHSALREVRSIRGLVFEEAEDVVVFTDEVVKAICSLLLPHVPSSTSMQGHARQDPSSTIHQENGVNIYVSELIS